MRRSSSARRPRARRGRSRGLPEPDAADGPPPPLTEDSRRALWVHAGLERDGEGLALLADDPHPLVRLIAASALARAESRGAHQRRDFPELDPALDGRHVTLVSGEPAVLAEWR